MNQRNLKDVRTANRANVLRLICERPGLTRQNVADKLRLSKMSAVNIVTEYVEKGYMQERIELGRDTDRSNVGRPSFSVFVVPDSVIVMGVYISEYEITCSLINLSCEILVSCTVAPTASETNEELFSIIDALMESVLNAGEKYTKNLFGIGLAAVGLIDAEEGTILCADNFPHIVDMRLKAYYEKKFGLPVIVSNDMNASLVAEKHYGSAIEARNFLYVGIGGYSVGLGMCINDNVYYGHNGFAGELGYTSIKFDGTPSNFGCPGQLESYTRIDRYVEKANRDWQEKIPGMPDFPLNRPIAWTDIIQEAKRGNAYCIDIIHEIGDYLSIAIVNVINLFDPEKVVVGGQLAAAGSILIDYVAQKTYNKSVKALLSTQKIRARYAKTEIVLSSFEDRIMAAGSGAIVFDALFQGKLTLL